MKKLLFIFSILFLISCTPDKVEVDTTEREKLTTIELVNLAKADTNIYHVVVKDDKIYVLNKSYIVEKKMENYSGELGTALIFMLVFMLLLICTLMML